MDEPDRDVRIGTGFVESRMARAFVTALTDRDPDVRRRAGERVGRWADVLAGMASGHLTIGSRTPVADLPAWATPDVLHGGFATGRALAAGPTTPHERAALERLGLPDRRAALFEHHLTEAGLDELLAVLDSGDYRVDVPEEAALLAVAALVRAGEIDAALDVVALIRPYADRLRFVPVPAPRTDVPEGVVWRRDVAAVRTELAARRVPPGLAAQREALAVWNPMADAFLELWSEPERDERWRARAGALLDRYRDAVHRHPLCRARHRRGNLAVLRDATREALAGDGPSARTRGMVRTVVRDMVHKRGAPGSAALAALRAAQARESRWPTHVDVAGVLLRRLADRPGDRGLTDPDALAAPVRDGEDPRVPDGTEVPSVLRRVLERAAEGTVGELLAAGRVPSAEVLAGLAPALVSARVASAYPDPVVRRLVAAHETAFARRRSLLLTDLSHQVRSDELPWTSGLARLREPGESGDGMLAAARELGRLAVEAFPGTPMPNPLVDRLRQLTLAAGVRLPWTDELAADIFTGTFSATFLRAAHEAAALLDGTVYARYYGIDPSRLPSGTTRTAPSGTAVADGLAELCRRRAGVQAGSWSVADNGRVIEQAQILTTHGVAVLAGGLGVRPHTGWTACALSALGTCDLLVRRAVDLRTRGRDGRPAIRRAAFAWRQMLALAALAERDGEPGSGPAFAVAATEATAGTPGLDTQVAVLREVLDGGRPREVFLGWVEGDHPVLDRASGPVRRR